MVRTLTKLATQTALAVGFAVGAGSAGAVLIDFDKGCGQGNRSSCTQNSSYASPHGFISVGGPPNFTLTVWGFLPTNVATPTFSKFNGLGSDETGLGLLNDPLGDNEIFPGSYIDDVLPAPTPGLSNIYSLIVSSVQSGESFNVYANAAAPGAASVASGLLFANVTNTCVGGTISGVNQCRFNINTTGLTQIAIQGVTGNVLEQTLTTNFTPPVLPEPATLALLGVGMFAAGLARRRKL